MKQYKRSPSSPLSATGEAVPPPSARGGLFSSQCSFMVFLFCLVFAMTLIEQSFVMLDRATPVDRVVDHPIIEKRKLKTSKNIKQVVKAPLKNRPGQVAARDEEKENKDNNRRETKQEEHHKEEEEEEEEEEEGEEEEEEEAPDDDHRSESTEEESEESAVSNNAESTEKKTIRISKISQEELNEPPKIDKTTLDTILEPIIEKWNLHDAPQAKALLEKIWYKENHYDSERDLVVFFHPLKTGGTSVSRLLENLGNVVPGSHESGSFNFDGFDYVTKRAKERAESQGTNWDLQAYKDALKSLYSHSPLREYGKGLNSTQTLHKFLLDRMPERRVRQITMVREPLAFVASNYNEWMCTLGKWLGEAKKQKLPPLPEGTEYVGCEGYTLDMLTQARIAKNEKDCKDFTPETAKDYKENVRKRCKAARRSPNMDHKPDCASTTNFLGSPSYYRFFHDHRAYERSTVNITAKATTADYVTGALEYLGGLEAPMKDGDLYGDMMWIGITERMKDSMCLLHYQLQLPWEETPTARMQSCRPIQYWAQPDRQRFYKMEPMMMAVHRAANAVLDVQLAKMRYHVAHLQSRLGDSVNLEFIGEGCLEPPELAVAKK